MTDRPPAPPPPAPAATPIYEAEGESEAFGRLTEGLPAGALQDPELRAILTERAEDLAMLTRGDSSEAVVNGNRWVHVHDPRTGQVGWVTGADYDAEAGIYMRADEPGEAAREIVAQRLVEESAKIVQERLATFGSVETYALSGAIAATGGKVLGWFDNDLARARVRASLEASPVAAIAGNVGALVSGGIVGGAAIGLAGGAIAGAANAAGGVGAAALQSGRLGYGAANLLTRGGKAASYLAGRATAARAAPGIRGAAVRAMGTASTLAAEGALGDMQMAYAQAAIDDRELSSEEVWSAAGNGAMWGLGAAGVLGGVRAMATGYRVGAPLAKKKLRSAAGRLLTGDEAAQAVGKQYADRGAFDRMVSRQHATDADIETFQQWRAGAGQAVDPGLAEELGAPGFAGRLGAATTPSGRRQAVEIQEQLAALDAAVDDLAQPAAKAAPKAARPPAPPAAGLQSLASDARAHSPKLRVQGTFIGRRLAKLRGVELTSEAITGEVNAAHRAFDDVKAEVFAALDGAEAAGQSALVANAAKIRTAFQRISPPAATRRPSARAGATAATAKRGHFSIPESSGTRGGARASQLGQSFLAFDDAGDVLRAAAGASTKADDASKSMVSELLGQLRQAQLGSPAMPSTLGAAGEAVNAAQASMDGVRGAQAALYGVAGGAPMPLGGAGKLDRARATATLRGQGADLRETGAAIEEYVVQARRLVELDPGAAKALERPLRALESRSAKVAPGLKARGAAAEAFAAQAPEGASSAAGGGYWVSMKRLLGGVQEASGRDIVLGAAIAMEPTLGSIYALGRKTMQSPTARALLVTAVTEARQRMARAVSAMQPAFEMSRVAYKPHLLGAAITRGMGAPDRSELDRMTPTAKRETYMALADGIRGQVEQMDLTVAQLAQATRATTALDPALGQSMQVQGAKALLHLAAELPEVVRDPLTGAAQAPGQGQIDSFLLTYRAVQDPAIMLEDLGAGTLRTETAEAVQAVYPSMFAGMAIEVSEAMQRAGDVPHQTRVLIGMMMGIPGSHLMAPSALLAFQRNYAGAQTAEEAQVSGLNARRRAESVAAARMPAASRTSAGRWRTVSEETEMT